MRLRLTIDVDVKDAVKMAQFADQVALEAWNSTVHKLYPDEVEGGLEDEQLGYYLYELLVGSRWYEMPLNMGIEVVDWRCDELT